MLRWGMVSLVLVLLTLALAARVSMTHKAPPEAIRHGEGHPGAHAGRCRPPVALSRGRTTKRRGFRPVMAPSSTPTAGWVVSGWVERPVDEESSSPVAGVLVRLSRLDGGVGNASETPAAENRTASDGSFKFTDLDGESRWRIEVDEPASALLVRSFELPEAEESSHKEFEVGLLLSPPADLLVRFVGPSGEPVVGANVVLDDGERTAAGVGGGEYALDRVAEGFHLLRVTAAGYQMRSGVQAELPQTVPLVIELEAGHRIAGKVLSIDGTPIEGTKLVCGEDEALTDRAGNFLFDTLGVGEFSFEVAAEGFVSSSHSVETGTEDYEFWLVPAAVFSGRVVSEDDESPVPEATIWVESSGDSLSGETDAAGEFTIGGILPGTYEGSVHHDSHIPLKLRARDFKSGESIAGQIIRLKKGLSLSGKVVDAETLEPINDARVEFDGPVDEAETSIQQESETDANGGFEITGLAKGEYSISASTPGYSKRVVSLEIQQGNSDEFTIPLERDGLISGVVLDPEGHALPDSSLVVWLFSSDGKLSESETADSEGNLSFGWSSDLSRIEIKASHKEFPTRIVVFEPIQTLRDVRVVEIRLERGGSIRGRVVDENGMGLTGAGVTATFKKLDDPGSKADRHGRYVETARSGEEGSYELSRLAAGTYLVEARADSRISPSPRVVKVLDGQSTEGVDFAFETGESLSGRVVDSTGTGVPSASVWVSMETGSAGTETDAAGRFQVSGLKPGKVEVSAGEAGDSSTVLRTMAPSDAVVLTLQPRASIRGRVVSAGQEVFPGGTVEIAPWSDGWWESNWSACSDTVDLDRTGRFRTLVQPGRTLLDVSVPGFARAELEIHLAPGEKREVVIPLEKGGTVQGKVVLQATGEPLKWADILPLTPAGSPAGSFSFKTYSELDGSFTLDGTPEGPLYLIVRHPGCLLARTAWLQVRAGGTVEARIELSAGQGIRGVLRSDGKPLSGARVTANSSGGSLQRNATSGLDGFYEISELPAGEYEVTVEASGLGGEKLQRTVDTTVADGEFAEAEIDFPAGLIGTR